jgi:CrcB protein
MIAAMNRTALVIPLWVAAGAAIGGLARYWCSGAIAHAFGETFPWGTLVVNVVGSTLIGFVFVVTGPDGRVLMETAHRQFIMTGIFGGFTTFSSFSLQTLTLLQDGERLYALANIALSVGLCLFGVWLGAALGALVNR